MTLCGWGGKRPGTGGSRRGAGRPRTNFTRRDKHQTKFDRGEFIVFDGEGYDAPDGRHVYAYLRSSVGYELFDIEGFSLVRVCAFLLWHAKRYPNAIFVAFGTGYDFTKILTGTGEGFGRGLRRERARLLVEKTRLTEVLGDPGVSEALTFSYIARKTLSVTRWDTAWKKGASIAIWDVWASFQSSLVEALKKWLPDDPRIPVISAGKERRAQHTREDFQGDRFDRMRTYTAAELSATADLMRCVRDKLQSRGLRPKRWDGPGAWAAEYFRINGVGRHLGLEDRPPDFAAALQRANYGGRAEAFRYGVFKDAVYYSDIVSAYPAALRNLPCLAHARLQRLAPGTIPAGGTFRLFHVRFDFPKGQLCYPFPWRDSSAGAIYFPAGPKGETWVWHWELEAGRAAGFEPEILDCWDLVPGCEEKPFAFIDSEFLARAILKNAGDAAENIIRLGLNSMWGKTEQSVGTARWREEIWGSMVTSQVRAELFRIDWLNRDTLIQNATDGIISSAPLVGINEGRGLGQWDVEAYPWGIFAPISGVYFLGQEGSVGTHPTEGRFIRLSTRSLEDNRVKIRQRGYDKKTLYPSLLVAGWDQGKVKTTAASRRFWTLNAASVSNKSWVKVGRWIAKPRSLGLIAEGKRVDVYGQPNAARGIVATVPARPPCGLRLGMSAPLLKRSQSSEKGPQPMED